MNIEERRQQIYQEREFDKKWASLLNPMTEEELRLLNNMVVQRIRMIGKLSAFEAMSRFKIGDKVKWKGNDGDFQTGEIIRLNSKTVSVRIDGDSEGYWTISPQLLEKDLS